MMAYGEMKYVVIDPDDEGAQLLFVFPKAINHDRFVQALAALKYGSDRNWERKYPRPISAGFTDGERCYGRSDTLKLSSRAEDSGLLEKGGEA